MVAFVASVAVAVLVVVSNAARDGDDKQVMLSGDMFSDHSVASAPLLFQNPAHTSSGCTCKSECGATVTHGYARCDWCWVEKNCNGSHGWNLTGSWDYCVYPKMVAWESLSYQEKEDELWKQTNAADVVGQSAPLLSTLGTVSAIVSSSMITTFDNQWDVYPLGRKKVIHSQGAIVKFDLDITADTFTGLFAAGKSQGLMRMGSATPVSTSMFPGFAVKFLRSGVRSANFVALSGPPSTENYNYFRGNFSNQVAAGKALQMLNKFQQASGCTDQVGLSDVCKYAQDGTEVDSSLFPFELIFVPVGVEFPTDKITPEELLQQLTSIKPGSHLFDVYTYNSPTHKKLEKPLKLGTLTTTSECVTSLFGDNKLFFPPPADGGRFRSPTRMD